MRNLGLPNEKANDQRPDGFNQLDREINAGFELLTQDRWKFKYRSLALSNEMFDKKFFIVFLMTARFIRQPWR